MTLITEQEITDTLNSYADETIATAYDKLAATMHEVRTHVQTARSLIQTAMQEIPAPLTSSTFEALAIAASHLWVALSAWEPEEEPSATTKPDMLCTSPRCNFRFYFVGNRNPGLCPECGMCADPVR